MEAITFSGFVFFLAAAIYFGSRSTEKPRVRWIEGTLAVWLLILVVLVLAIGLGQSVSSKMETVPAPSTTAR
jgi:O-antigen ligase